MPADSEGAAVSAGRDEIEAAQIDEFLAAWFALGEAAPRRESVRVALGAALDAVRAGRAGDTHAGDGPVIRGLLDANQRLRDDQREERDRLRIELERTKADEQQARDELVTVLTETQKLERRAERAEAERDVLKLGYEGARQIAAADAEKLAKAEADLRKARETLNEVGKWLSQGDITGYEVVLQSIETTLEASDAGS